MTGNDEQKENTEWQIRWYRLISDSTYVQANLCLYITTNQAYWYSRFRHGLIRNLFFPDSLIENIHRKITEAFDLFDHESNKTVDVREVGTIIRSLGCCPSEAELHDMLAEIEEEEPTGYIRFEKFIPMMTKVLMERRYKPAPEDQLLKAFQVLDSEGHGYLTQEELTKCMTAEGEPFNQEELEEMLSAALDPDKNTIQYKEYVSLMSIEET